jgi:GNAT superfamily N-acetyltransferase
MKSGTQNAPSGLLPLYAIVAGRAEHIPALNDIELAAARLLEGYAPESVLREASSAAELRAAIDAGLLWVAVSDARPVGFAHVKLLETGRAHLDELDVHPDHGRRGVGRSLVRAVCEWAAGSYLDAVTLSTFRAPPWNAPFYASMGFRALTEPELTPALRRVVAQETRRGLDPAQRVVMYRGTRRSQTWW